MATYDVGQTIVWGLRTYDSTGALADLGGGLPTATVTRPDGTTTTATVVKTATGTYTASLTSTMAGRHRVTWTGSGANSGGLPYGDSADVWPSDPRLIISLADARAALNLPAANTASDDEIRLYIAAATDVIEDIVGAVLTASKVETVSGRGRAGIGLSELPQSITSVVEDGTTLAATAYCFDEAGILWRGSQPNSACWSSASPRNVVVTYTVGAAGIVSPLIVSAARELVKFQYQTSQQASRPAFAAGLPDASPSFGPRWAVPDAVMDKLRAYRNTTARKMPGFA